MYSCFKVTVLQINEYGTAASPSTLVAVERVNVRRVHGPASWVCKYYVDCRGLKGGGGSKTWAMLY